MFKKDKKYSKPDQKYAIYKLDKKSYEEIY